MVYTLHEGRRLVTTHIEGTGGLAISRPCFFNTQMIVTHLGILGSWVWVFQCLQASL